MRRVSEGSIVSIPGTQADLAAVFDYMLDAGNRKPLAKLKERQIGLCALMQAGSVVRTPNDLSGFANDLVNNYLELSVAEEGYRSQQLTAVASGFIAAMKDLQKYEAAQGAKSTDLEKRGLI